MSHDSNPAPGVADLDLFNQDAQSPFDAICRTDVDGEFWSARELMPMLGYAKWERFEDTIERALISARIAGGEQGFSRCREDGRSSSTGYARDNYRLSRHACYLVAMVGDVNKPEIAAALGYFAVRTREAETAAATLALPKSYAEALRELAESVERTETERAAREVAERRVTELAPAATAWEQLVAEGGDHLVGDVAKVLQRAGIDTGPRRLYDTLSDLGWVYRGGDRAWRPMQRAITSGWLVERLTGTHENPQTGERLANPPQVRVTAKGVEALHARMSRAALALVVNQ